MYSQIDSNKRKSIILIIIFIILVLFLGWFLSQISNTGYTIIIIAAIIALGMSLSGYYSGDKIALWSAGAKEIKKQDNQYVYNIVENLCITSGIPVPKIYIIKDSSPNAFATGRDPQHASIALTTGIIAQLENEELEGVIAHELSHIKNYDIRLMTLVLVLVGTISILANWFLYFGPFGKSSSDNEQSTAGTILLIVGLILMILSPIIAKLIQLAISRKREFLADASAALLTRYPEGLAKALEKISQNTKPLKRANNATAHLYIANPFGNKKSIMAKLFSTHPPIQERINALRKM